MWKFITHSRPAAKSFAVHSAFSLPLTSTHFTPWRILKVQVKPPSSVPHSSAMPGTSLPSVSTSSRPSTRLVRFSPSSALCEYRILKVSNSRVISLEITRSLISSPDAGAVASSFFSSSFFSPPCSVVLPVFSAGFSSVVPPPPQPLSTRAAVKARASNLDAVFFILFTSSFRP